MRLENLSLPLLVALAGPAPACFSPSSGGDPEAGATGGETQATEDPETGTNPSAPSTSGEGEPAGETSGGTETGEVDPTEQTGGTETGEVDATEDTGGEDTGGEDTGGEETGGEDTGGEDTGELCMEELGTFEHCLDCDDTCSEGETCSPGGCAAADAVGFPEPFAGIGGHPNQLWGFAVEVEEDAWLGSLNFHGVGNGGDIQLALYSDAAGSPGDLLALSEALESYSAGPYSLDVDPIALPAGTYWLMARNDFPSQIGLDFDPDVAAYFPLTSIVLDFDEAMPETLGDSFTFPSYPINLWMTVLLPS